MYEFCVVHERYPSEVHRGPMSEAEADQWIADWLADGGRGGVFYVARREVTEWERADA